MLNTKSLLKISMLGLGFAGVVLLAPSCRAQSEIDPDHFDGTDSWALAAGRKAPASKTKLSSIAPSQQARRGGPIATSNLSKARAQLVALNDGRKVAVRKSNKQ